MFNEIKQALTDVTCAVFNNVDPRACIMIAVFSTPVVMLWTLGTALFPVQ